MSVIKTISFTLFFLSIIAIVYSLTKAYHKCPNTKIIYRNNLKSFKDEQKNPTPLKSIFGNMFDQPSPWVGYTDQDSTQAEVDSD
tara:strand:- start:156 stop:410 length:255 start_codon:yes stop_codon:yes gene_type:complete